MKQMIEMDTLRQAREGAEHIGIVRSRLDRLEQSCQEDGDNQRALAVKDLASEMADVGRRLQELFS